MIGKIRGIFFATWYMEIFSSEDMMRLLSFLAWVDFEVLNPKFVAQWRRMWVLKSSELKEPEVL